MPLLTVWLAGHRCRLQSQGNAAENWITYCCFNRTGFSQQEGSMKCLINLTEADIKVSEKEAAAFKAQKVDNVSVKLWSVNNTSTGIYIKKKSNYCLTPTGLRNYEVEFFCCCSGPTKKINDLPPTCSTYLCSNEMPFKRVYFRSFIMLRGDDNTDHLTLQLTFSQWILPMILIHIVQTYCTENTFHSTF